MNTVFQMTLPNFDPLVKLCVVEAVLKQHVDPVPSRHTIVCWIEEGLLEGRQHGRGRQWHVYRSSLQNFIDSYYPPREQRLAA